MTVKCALREVGRTEALGRRLMIRINPQLYQETEFRAHPSCPAFAFPWTEMLLKLVS